MIEKDFHLCFFGSRSLDDERVKKIILFEIKKHKPSAILTAAEPAGVCLMTKEIAKGLSIPLKLHFLNFKYLRGAFEHRSRDILKDSSHCILIHDGESIGTANELKLAKKMQVPHTYYRLQVLEGKKKERIKKESSWDKLEIKEAKTVDGLFSRLKKIEDHEYFKEMENNGKRTSQG